MEIGKTYYPRHRGQWRSWLKKRHRSAREIWLVYCKKSSGKPSVAYGDAVEEALCFGWIDSTMKSLDAQRYAQRFTPRRPGSELSETNKDRVRRMLAARKMTKFGLEKIAHAFDEHRTGRREKFTLPPDILRALRKDPKAWKHYRAFPERYRRIRVGWLVMSKRRPEVFRKRLRYFLKMTAANKKFGMLR